VKILHFDQMVKRMQEVSYQMQKRLEYSGEPIDL
jgi:hypothetical protein